MSALRWADQPGPCIAAHGRAGTYFIAWDSCAVVLARQDTEEPVLAQLQIALTTVRIRAQGAQDQALAIVRLKQMAQEYDSGLDVTGQPAWQQLYPGLTS